MARSTPISVMSLISPPPTPSLPHNNPAVASSCSSVAGYRSAHGDEATKPVTTFSAADWYSPREHVAPAEKLPPVSELLRYCEQAEEPRSWQHEHTGGGDWRRTSFSSDRSMSSSASFLASPMQSPPSTTVSSSFPSPASTSENVFPRLSPSAEASSFEGRTSRSTTESSAPDKRRTRRPPTKTNGRHINIRYTREQLHFIVFHSVDLGLPWSEIGHRYAALWPSQDLNRTVAGIQSVSYRVNRDIPVRTDDGLLVLGEHFEQAYKGVGYRREHVKVRGGRVPLLLRWPEDLLTYAWVPAHYKAKAAPLAEARRRQREAYLAAKMERAIEEQRAGEGARRSYYPRF